MSIVMAFIKSPEFHFPFTRSSDVMAHSDKFSINWAKIMLTFRDTMMNQTQCLPLSYCIFTQGLVGVNLKVLSIASADSEMAARRLQGVGTVP